MLLCLRYPPNYTNEIRKCLLYAIGGMRTAVVMSTNYNMAEEILVVLWQLSRRKRGRNQEIIRQKPGGNEAETSLMSVATTLDNRLSWWKPRIFQ